MNDPTFRYDKDAHRYFLDGQEIPGITMLLQQAGLVEGSQYFTEASRHRGTAVHNLCRAFDLGMTIAPDAEHIGYLAAYETAMERINAKWDAIEEAEYSPDGWAGRPDRSGSVFDSVTVAEIKSGGPAGHHSVQTALQAMLLAPRYALPAEKFQRLCVYVKANGKFRIAIHDDPRDFITARRILPKGALCSGR